MSKDPDAEPEAVEDEPRRFPWPTRSAVASTAMVSLIVLGGGAFVRSIATPESSADQTGTVETTVAEHRSEPGAASVDDSVEDPAPDDSALYGSTADGSSSEDSATSEWSAPAGPPPEPRPIDRRELGPPDDMPPGPPMRDRLRTHGDVP